MQSSASVRGYGAKLYRVPNHSIRIAKQHTNQTGREDE